MSYHIFLHFTCLAYQAGSIDWHALLHQMPADVFTSVTALGTEMINWDYDQQMSFFEARAGVKHIVLLPNYMESEKMMKESIWLDWETLEPSKAWDRKTFPQFFGSIFEETLDNLARSRLARSCVHVVLAMEASVFDVFHDAVAGILWCSPRKGCTRGTLMSIRGWERLSQI